MLKELWSRLLEAQHQGDEAVAAFMQAELSRLDYLGGILEGPPSELLRTLAAPPSDDAMTAAIERNRTVA